MTLARYAIINGTEVINVIEYEQPPGNPPPGFDEGIIAVQNDLAGLGWSYINGQFLPPTSPPLPPEQLIERCRAEAIARLSATDWIEMPSVNNTSVVPHLTNVQEFLQYRTMVRMYAVTPVVDPTWPQKPEEIWSTK